MKRAVAVWLTCLALVAPRAFGGFAEEMAERFKASDIQFQRGSSLVPFIPLANLTVSTYSDTDVKFSDGTEAEYDLRSVSQYAVLPMPVSRRDAVLVGEYIQYSDFDVESGQVEDFAVTSVGFPVGWLRQASPRWQLAAFAMPLFHNSNLELANWSYQVLSGAFGRYTASESLWWVFGMYANVSPEDDFYTPYIGASWTINRHWSLSAMMPWPAIHYAPDERWLISLGASPSGASWNVASGRDDVAINYDAWDLALGVERRVLGNVWVGARAGIGGMRGVRASRGDLDWPDIDVGSSGFFALSVNFRPSTGE